MQNQTIREKFDAITNSHYPLAEIVTKEELLQALAAKHCKSLWGISVGRVMHLGYDSLITKQWSMINHGIDHTILIADMMTKIEKPDIQDIEIKTDYVYAYLRDLCKLHGATFVKGSSFQTTPEYTKILHSLIGATKVSMVQKLSAGAQRPTLGNLVYPAMQVADGVYLDCSIVYGGSDQRGTYIFGREILPKINLKKPVMLLSPLSLDITGNRLAASRTETRITIHDNEKSLEKKIAKMFAPASATTNPLLDTFKYSILPWFNKVSVTTENGNTLIKDYSQLENLYVKGAIKPKELKSDAYLYLLTRLNGIRRYFDKKSYLTDWIDMSKINKPG